jgi:hypothetical protein
MKTLSNIPKVNSDYYKPNLSVIAGSVDIKSTTEKPVVDIQYINAEDLENKSYAKPKPKTATDVTKNYSSARLKKNKSASLFSLSNTGIALGTVGALDFFATKQYLAGSLLLGGGLLACAVGKTLDNRK